LPNSQAKILGQSASQKSQICGFWLQNYQYGNPRLSKQLSLSETPTMLSYINNALNNADCNVVAGQTTAL